MSTSQYWKIVALHDREIHKEWGNLRSFLFDGSASFLAMQLAVPVLDWIERDIPVASTDGPQPPPPTLRQDDRPLQAAVTVVAPKHWWQSHKSKARTGVRYNMLRILGLRQHKDPDRKPPSRYRLWAKLKREDRSGQTLPVEPEKEGSSSSGLRSGAEPSGASSIQASETVPSELNTQASRTVPSEPNGARSTQIRETVPPEPNGASKTQASEAVSSELGSASNTQDSETVLSEPSPSPSRPPLGQFGSLPIEIHHAIFSQIDYYADILRLSLTNQYFWLVGRQHLRRCLSTTLGRLSNKALICVGKNSATPLSDYPTNLLTDAEKAELRSGLDEDEIEWYYQGEHSDDVQGPVNLYTLAGARFSRVTLILQPSHPSWPSFGFRHMAVREVWNTGHRLPPQALALVRPKFEQLFPADREWVLRNLTTNEFVRAAPIAVRKEFVNGPIITGIGFGEVVLARICWSSDPDGAEGIHRGVWAGHRFDITTADKIEEDGWKDVSEEVASEMQAIWQSEFGDSWKAVVESRSCR